MIHYTCDMCERLLDPKKDVRFKVEISIQMKSCSEEDHDVPIMGSVEDEILGFISDDGIEDMLPDLEESYQHLSFDLCSTCHKIFLRDPLFKNVRQRFGFHQN